MPDPSRYAIPAGRHRVEQTIQRSRFVATIDVAASAEAAAALVREVSGELVGATHNCWAYLVGRPGTSDRIGMSDDGEPHGTAGRPILNVLTHSGVGDIAAVVTRYYGGTKLGTGGLSRAYGGTTQLALESLALSERVDVVEMIAVVEYDAVAALKALVLPYEAAILEEVYAANVTVRLRLPLSNVDELRRALADATRGRAILRDAS